MAQWYPISGTVPQYTDANGDPYSGAVLKFYAEGTSNVTSLATDDTGGTTATSVALNAAGYPEISANVLIPHLSVDYKISLYPTQAAADADSGAIWTVDNVPVTDSDNIKRPVDFGTGLDAASLQGALDAADTDGGGKVEIPPNTTIDIGTSTITIGANTTLCGHGESSFITSTGAGRVADQHILENKDLVAGNSDIRIKDLRIFGDRSNTTAGIAGVSLTNCSNAVLSGLIIEDTGAAIELVSCTDCLIDGNFFKKITENKSGIVLERDATNNERITITNNFFGETLDEAIDINNASLGVVIDSNTFFKNHTDGVTGDSEVIDVGSTLITKDVVISNNILDLDGAARTGIQVKFRCENVVIKGNTIKDGNDTAAEADSAGVRISNSNRVVVQGNTITNMRYGLIVADQADTPDSIGMVIDGNIIRDVTIDGIWFKTVTGTTRSVKMTNNDIDGVAATGVGILAADVFGLIISGNEIWDFDSFGIDIASTCDRVQIVDNIIKDVAGTGIRSLASNVGISLNQIVDAGSHGINFQGTGTVINGNRIHSSVSDNIFVGAITADRAVITGNLLTSAGDKGLDIGFAVTEFLVANNVFFNNAGGEIGNYANAGNNSVIRHNSGFITENSSNGTIANGATSVVITHGLSTTPTARDIQIIGRENPTNDVGTIWISTITSTQFTVNVENDPGGSNWDFGWHAQIL